MNPHGERTMGEPQTRKAPLDAPDAGFGLVEVLVAVMVFSIGLLALAGMALGIAQQSRSSTYWAEQSLVGQEVMSAMIDAGYSKLSTGTKDTTIQMGPRTYTVTRTVENKGPRARSVELVVERREEADPAVLQTVVHLERTQPTEYTP